MDTTTMAFYMEDRQKHFKELFGETRKESIDELIEKERTFLKVIQKQGLKCFSQYFSFEKTILDRLNNNNCDAFSRAKIICLHNNVPEHMKTDNYFEIFELTRS